MRKQKANFRCFEKHSNLNQKYLDKTICLSHLSKIPKNEHFIK